MINSQTAVNEKINQAQFEEEKNFMAMCHKFCIDLLFFFAGGSLSLG